MINDGRHGDGTVIIFIGLLYDYLTIQTTALKFRFAGCSPGDERGM